MKLWRKSKNNTEIPASPCSRARTGCASVPRSFSALTIWRAVSTRCLRSSPTPLTKPERATATPSSLPATKIYPWKWRTSAGAVPWTTTKKKSATTGNWCSAKCTPAASTARTGKTTSILWALTAWAPALPSTLPNILTLPSAGTASGMTCTLKRAEMWAA